MKARIVERTSPDGRVKFIIQQKHWLFWWMWTDAWVNSLSGACCRDYFDTEAEARANLCYFDGTKARDRVIPRATDSEGGGER